MKIYNFEPSELTDFANRVKDNLVYALQKEGKLKDAEEIAGSYVVIVHEPSWLGRIFSRLRKKEYGDSNIIITIAKAVDR